MAFGLGCFSCCTPCEPCEAVCNETPDTYFQTVYPANPYDDILEWTGDMMGPIDGPFPGFEGDGPFSQTITLAEGASIGLPGDRFPCVARFRVWRNIPGGEGNTDITAALHISCNSGRVSIGPVVLSAGESATFKNAPWSIGETATYYFEAGSPPIPLVGGEFDQSSNPPDLWGLSAVALCAPASITVRATIGWANPSIQHAIYGHMMECFDEPSTACPIDCDGAETALPGAVYLQISNWSFEPEPGFGEQLEGKEGTYALDLSFEFGGCAWYQHDIANWYPDPWIRAFTHVLNNPTAEVGFSWKLSSGPTAIAWVTLDYGDAGFGWFCGGSSQTPSGTVTAVVRYSDGPYGQATTFDAGVITFDWELTA